MYNIKRKDVLFNYNLIQLIFCLTVVLLLMKLNLTENNFEMSLDVGTTVKINRQVGGTSLAHLRQIKIPNIHGTNQPGYLGRPVIVPQNLTEDIKTYVDEGWRRNTFNQFVSDMISVKRILPDVRDEGCKTQQYHNLPPTSVIICFYNEAWSTLLRTVHSVLDRSPPHLVKEIILVDDYSDLPHLWQQLEDYMSLFPKVTIIRSPLRVGLVGARLLGLKHTTADLVTFLDSHCECTDGWLEPLLDRINKNRTVIASPVIHKIDENTFELKYTKPSLHIGGFNWKLQFRWQDMPKRDRMIRLSSTQPMRTPTIAGGLFAIDKHFFEELGTYDSGFKIWGTENLELSFKAWMCGGSLEIVPCSRVGHVFRKKSPYLWKTGINVMFTNGARLAEVWLDDYAKYFYMRIGQRNVSFGDVSNRKELRQQMRCKSFDWYLKNVYPELFIPKDLIAFGQFSNKGIRNACLANRNPAEADLSLCNKESLSQFWMYTKTGEIRFDEYCMDNVRNKLIFLKLCDNSKISQVWIYHPHSMLLVHKSTKLCLTAVALRRSVRVATCNATEIKQQWILQHYDSNKAKVLNKISAPIMKRKSKRGVVSRPVYLSIVRAILETRPTPFLLYGRTIR